MRMTNREKFREVYGFDTDCGKCNPYPCKEDDCEWWEQCKDHPGCPCENWWDNEYKAPAAKNNLAHNLCDSCTNIGCELQSGIVRTKCAFYMSSITQQEPRKGHWVIDTHKIRAFGTKYETHNYSVHCDKCNYAWDYTTDKLGSGSLVSNFCPNCGAKMESEET